MNAVQTESNEQLLTRTESKMREKVRISIKKKLEVKIIEKEIDDAAAAELEKELLEDREEMIQKELATYRFTLENMEEENSEDSNNYAYESEDIPRFYWAGEDCNEMVFFDD